MLSPGTSCRPLAAVVGVPCLDANTLAADATCSGEKVPNSARGAYRSAQVDGLFGLLASTISCRISG